jgi:mono/diheme cytochrome c family protein/rhodanese-related sulfurtransferase
MIIGITFAATLIKAQTGKTEKAEAGPRKQVEHGKDLYRKYCAFCHGHEGEGYLADEANALANQDFLAAATDDFIIEAVVRGRPGTPMSAWGMSMGGVLSDSDVLALLAFIRSWQVEEPVDLSMVRVEGNPERGSKVFATRCAGCHGKRGEGAMAPSLNNPVFHETASDGFIRHAVARGRRNTPMPAFEGDLSPQQIDDVVAFVRTLKSSAKRPPIDPDKDIVPIPERLKMTLVNPDGPPAKFSPRDGRYVPADVVYTALTAKQSFVILDARPHNDYLEAHVEGAISVPFYDVEAAVYHLPRDRWIIAYCVCPHAMSGQAVDALREAGFDKTAVLDEGFSVWRERGYPVATSQ